MKIAILVRMVGKHHHLSHSQANNKLLNACLKENYQRILFKKESLLRVPEHNIGMGSITSLFNASDEIGGNELKDKRIQFDNLFQSFFK